MTRKWGVLIGLLVLLCPVYLWGLPQSDPVKLLIAYSNLGSQLADLVSSTVTKSDAYFETGSELAERVKALATKALQTGSIDEKVWSSAKSSLDASSVREYNSFHQTDLYRRVHALESREISQADFDSYRYDRESQSRQQSLVRILKSFGTQRHRYLYDRAIYLNLQRLANFVQKQDLEFGLASLDANLLNYYSNSDEEVSETQWLGLVYSGLTDTELAAYSEFFARPSVVKIYETLYQSLYAAMSVSVIEYLDSLKKLGVEP